MIIHWLLGKNMEKSNIKLGMLLIFTSFVGGYMVADFPKESLDIFTTPLGQVISFVAINLLVSLNEDNKITPFEIITESIIAMLILQLTKSILNYIYGK